MARRFRVLVQSVHKRFEDRYGYMLFDRYDCDDIMIEETPTGLQVTGYGGTENEMFEVRIADDNNVNEVYPAITGLVLIFDRDRRQIDFYPKDY